MERHDIETLEDGDGGGLSRRQFLGAGAGALGAVALGGLAPAAASAAESAAGAKRGGTIKIAISDETTKDSYDPQRNSSTMGLLSAGLMYDSLLKLDNRWNVTPMLAEEWSASKKGNLYTFKLRRGVEFHDGKTFDARDVEYTFKRMLAGGAALHGAAVFGPVLDAKGIQVVDPYTVRFHLKQPDGFFPIKLGFWYGRIIERNANFKHSQGTGPFKGKSYKGGQGFQLVRNPNYWQHGLPYLDGVNGLAVTDLATKIESVISGDVDFADPGSYSSTKQVVQSKTAQMLVNDFGFPYVMGIDSTAKPYNDPRVRQAMKLLIDRQKYVQIVAQGAATGIADLFIHPKDPFYPPGLKPPAHDPEQAKSLLKQAGYENGWKDNAWTTDLPGMVDMAVLFKASMADGGIDISVQNVPQEQWVKQLFNASIVANYWGRQNPSTMALYMAKSGGQWNEARLKDPKIDRWIAEAQATTNVKRQQAIYHEIGSRYAHETSCIWPFWSKNLWPHKKRLKGLTTNPTDFVDFRRASLA